MVGKSDKIKKIAEGLWDEPSEKNWKAFSSALRGSGISYYRVKFQNGGKLNRIQDLAKSFAELYDAKYKLVTKVPIFKKEGKSMRGATIYLIDLKVYNK
jgi:hypothetical protein